MKQPSWSHLVNFELLPPLRLWFVDLIFLMSSTLHCLLALFLFYYLFVFVIVWNFKNSSTLSSSSASLSSTWSVLLVRFNDHLTVSSAYWLFTYKISLWCFPRFSISLPNPSLLSVFAFVFHSGVCVFWVHWFSCSLLCYKHSLVILLNSLPRIPPNLLPLESIFVKLVSFEEVIFP